MMMRHFRAFTLAAVVVIALPLIGADTVMQHVPVKDIGTKFIIEGELGKPLGTFLNIEGVKHPGPLKGSAFDVDTIDGVKIEKPLIIGIQGDTEMDAGVRYTLRGYESGAMESSPMDPLKQYSSQPQQSYHFAHWFQVTETKTEK
jgi:hypothetical protein